MEIDKKVHFLGPMDDNIKQLYTTCTVMARVSARALINFVAPILPALIRGRRLFETRRLMFSVDKILIIYKNNNLHGPII